jgi:hypothetical protein
MHCTCKFESININMKSVNNLSLVKTIIELSIIKAYKIGRCSMCSLYHPDFIDKNCSSQHSIIVGSFVLAYLTVLLSPTDAAYTINIPEYWACK